MPPIPLPSGVQPFAVASDGQNLWAITGTSPLLWVQRYDQGVWVRAGQKVRVGNPGPMTWARGALWVVDEAAGEIVPVELAAANLGEVNQLPRHGGGAMPTPAATPAPVPVPVPIPPEALRFPSSITGLAWDGRAFWICTACGLCSSFLQIRDDGTVLQRFFPYCDPRGLVFLHNHLWTVHDNGPNLEPRLSWRRAARSTVTSLHVYRLNRGLDPNPDVSGDSRFGQPGGLVFYGGRLRVVDRSGVTAKLVALVPTVREFPRQVP